MRLCSSRNSLHLGNLGPQVTSNTTSITTIVSSARRRYTDIASGKRRMEKISICATLIVIGMKHEVSKCDFAASSARTAQA